MLILAAAAAALEPGAAGVRVIARSDGALLEIRSASPAEHEVEPRGMQVDIICGIPVGSVEGSAPFWIDSLWVSPDRRVLSCIAAPAVTAVDFATSPDGQVTLVMLRAADPLPFPDLHWAGPPVEPETPGGVYSDSSIAQALSQGEPSPWLENFDVVVLDPGHGGRDPGAVGASGTFEKDRTLEIALLTRDLLALRMPNVRVVLTRSDDSYVPLAARTRIANREQADLFVSIHCNAATRREAGGFETFFLSLARTDDARAVSAMENAAAELDDPSDPMAQGDALSFLLADMAQSVFLSQSSALASLVQQNLSREWPDGRDRGVKQAGFYVLRGAFMPSILVETAFISNPREEALLESLDFRFRAARAIVAAIEEFAMGRGSGW